MRLLSARATLRIAWLLVGSRYVVTGPFLGVVVMSQSPQWHLHSDGLAHPNGVQQQPRAQGLSGIGSVGDVFADLLRLQAGPNLFAFDC